MAKSIDVPGVRHNAPIPMGAKVGNMVFSSGIMGTNPETGQQSADPAEQAKFLFQNIRSFMKEAGGTVENIGHMTVLLKDDSYRDVINAEWEKMFPNPDARPARHSLAVPLRGSMLFQVELIAVLG
ncbi:MAG: RidA family protein [Chloroflexi bacterium]|nr:RidA family protein [Chloroflexota bacterium]